MPATKPWWMSREGQVGYCESSERVGGRGSSILFLQSFLRDSLDDRLRLVRSDVGNGFLVVVMTGLLLIEKRKKKVTSHQPMASVPAEAKIIVDRMRVRVKTVMPQEVREFYPFRVRP